MGNIALQVQRTAAGSTAAAQPVVFDNVVYSAGNIGYSTSTGTVTFNETGRYFVLWWIATLSATSALGVTFSLTSSHADNIQSDSTIKTGEAYGMGIIGVTAVQETLTLVNRCTGAVNYSTALPVKASLMVFKIEPDAGSSDSSYCLAVSQLAWVISQLISYYPPATVYSVFTKTATTFTGAIDRLYASPDAYGAGMMIMKDGNDTYAFPLNEITVIATQPGTAYDTRISYLSPGLPLPKGCDTNIIASIQSYLTISDYLPAILLTPFTTASGNVYKNEYGMLVLGELDGSAPIFIPTYNIVEFTKTAVPPPPPAPLLPPEQAVPEPARSVSVVINRP